MDGNNVDDGTDDNNIYDNNGDDNVDGTIVETEDFHRRSFNESFKEFNLII